jgi:hypothetical protein
MIRLTNHAVDRYIERVKPALDRDAARSELQALVRAAGEPSSEQPEWHAREVPCSLYLEISDGIVATVQEQAVTSVITRGGSGPDAKERRKREKKKRQADRKHQRKTLYRSGRPERKAISWE